MNSNNSLPPLPDLNSQLPETVQSLKNIENKAIEKSSQLVEEKQNTDKANKESKKLNKKKLFYVTFTLFLFVLIVFLVLLVTLLNKGTVGIKGKVVDSSNQTPIPNAIITIDVDTGTFTNESGFYEINNLKSGNVKIIVQAPGYKSVTKNVSLTLGLLGGGVSVVNFELEPLEKFEITGKIVFENQIESITFTDAKILVGEKEFAISSNGEFKINVPIGTKEIAFSGSQFIDFVIEVDAKENVNLGELEIQPASNIKAYFVDYITNSPLKPNVEITNIPKEKIVVKDDGNLEIDEIEAFKDYTLEITLDGYLTKSFQFTSEIGEVNLFTIKLTPVGKKAFWSSVNRKVELFVSNYDGTDLTQVTNSGYLNPIGGFYDLANNTYYFQSDHEKFRNEIRRYAFLPYKIDLNNPQPKRLVSNFDNLGYIFADFLKDKYVQIAEDPTNDKKWNLEIINFDGSDKKIIDSANLNNNELIEEVLISSNANIVFYVKKQNETQKLLSYDIDKNSSRILTEANKIRLIDTNNEKVLFRMNDSELKIANVNNFEIKTIQPVITGFDYQFDRTDPSLILFLSQKGADTLVNYIEISNLQLNTLITLNNKVVEDLYYENGYYFYRTKDELFMFDRNKPIDDVSVFKGITYDNRNFQYDI
ncbi:MAG: hypothetical protein KatS3mg085_849 [Candidatus Dojkabacteria bacterium]|nr:MAG: hypothetical protein KatS3mg085_849 [Candidatus Dojkabacteria bacterium]